VESSAAPQAVPMTYWQLGDRGPGDTPGLLKQGDGRCGAWARLLVDCARIHGLDAEFQDYQPPQIANANWFQADLTAAGLNTQVNSSSTLYMFIKSWKPAPHAFVTMDSISKAQGDVPDPEGKFPDHVLVKFGGGWYDPSYGKPYSSIAAWEDGALHGFGLEANTVPIIQVIPPLPVKKYWMERRPVAGTQLTTLNTSETH
jgi:hypothetical protein